MPTAFERALEQAVPAVIEETVRVAEIPAPTFHERDRARYVYRRFEAIGGWDHLAIDGIANVVAIRRGDPRAARLMVAAHLDTVFPDAETPVRRSRGRLTGRGVGDNSAGVASLLHVAEAMQRTSPRGAGDIIFATDVGEEGRGDLRGVRRLTKDYGSDFDCFIAVEGHSLNRIQTGFTASYRYEVSIETDGGHSWGAYGRKNAIALLARVITALEPLMPEVGIIPKTTMNVGVIRGGRSVNTIAPDALFELDMRSADPTSLERLWGDARRVMRAAVAGEADVQFRRIGTRPGGSVRDDIPLIGAVLAARRGLGLPRLEFSSSDSVRGRRQHRRERSRSGGLPGDLHRRHHRRGATHAPRVDPHRATAQGRALSRPRDPRRGETAARARTAPPHPAVAGAVYRVTVRIGEPALRPHRGSLRLTA